MIMITEALRLQPISKVFTEDLGTETFLKDHHVNLILRWGQISYCLWLWDRNGAWPPQQHTQGLETMQTLNAADALKNIGFLNVYWDNLCLNIILHAVHHIYSYNIVVEFSNHVKHNVIYVLFSCFFFLEDYILTPQ